LHLAFLLPFIGSMLGTYYLARQLCAHPALAALMTLVMPVFLLCGVTVMCDTFMVAFWVWAAALWVRGLDRKNNLLLAISGLLMAGSALSKYFGICLIPLLLLYSLAKARERKAQEPDDARNRDSFLTRWGWLGWLLIPVAILVAYQWVTHSLYGRGLLLDA